MEELRAQRWTRAQRDRKEQHRGVILPGHEMEELKGEGEVVVVVERTAGRSAIDAATLAVVHDILHKVQDDSCAARGRQRVRERGWTRHGG